MCLCVGVPRIRRLPSARAVPRLMDGARCAASCSLLSTGGQHSQPGCQTASARLTRERGRRAGGTRVRVCFPHAADHVSIKAIRRATVAEAHHVPIIDSIAFFLSFSFFSFCSDGESHVFCFFFHLPVRFYVLERQYDLKKREFWAQLVGSGCGGSGRGR